MRWQTTSIHLESYAGLVQLLNQRDHGFQLFRIEAITETGWHGRRFGLEDQGGAVLLFHLGDWDVTWHESSGWVPREKDESVIRFGDQFPGYGLSVLEQDMHGLIAG